MLTKALLIIVIHCSQTHITVQTTHLNNFSRQGLPSPDELGAQEEVYREVSSSPVM